VELDQRGAGLAEAAVVLGPLPEAGALAGGEGSQAGLSLLGPGKHRRGVQRPFLGSAVAGGLSAAGLELVDGALDQLARGEQLLELALVLGAQRLEGQAQAAGAVGFESQDRDLLFMLYIMKT